MREMMHKEEIKCVCVQKVCGVCGRERENLAETQ